MGELGLQYALDIIKALGLPGIIFIIWWMDQKAQTRMLNAYREDTKKTLAQYHDDMVAMRQMYDSNVILVKQYGDLCTNLREIVVVNTAQMANMNNLVENNLFCPLMRKEAKA